MRRSPTAEIERYRYTDGPMGTTADMGANGAFAIPLPSGVIVNVIASDGSDWRECDLPGIPWEHVSVSLARRCPTWEEMDAVKRIFWRDDELVIQMHVPRERHVNCHPFCLHLWKPIGVEIPLPPMSTVGPAARLGS